MSLIDHLVIVAADLEQGCDHCERLLGVRPAAGGEHLRMGTHNRLLALGDRTYLEVIAIRPGSDPGRPRWFGMDSGEVRHRAARAPFLATFVAHSEDIDRHAAALPEVGPVAPMERGSLHWRITITPDGGLREAGLVPPLIQWPAGVDPTAALADTGCRLIRLSAWHPEPARLRTAWQSVGLDDRRLVLETSPTGTAPRLEALVDTPAGPRRLS